MELTPGSEIDRYRVDAILGEGGTATVFLVSHRQLKTKRALKVLHVANKRLQERLAQEAMILSTIEHLNIVRIIDALEVDGSPAVVMEYVNGPPLDKYLAESPPSIVTAEQIFLGILDGVERAHNAGIVHRDLKPANVLLSIEFGKPVPKVADFGIARVLGEAEGARMTKAGSAMGTPSYMAPEQIMNAAGADQRADVFALGCILYELLTGRLAFDGPNYVATFDLIRAGSYVAPEELVPELQGRFSNTIRACLQQDRERRPPTCAAIRGLLNGSAATAVPVEQPRAEPQRTPVVSLGKNRRTSETFLPDMDNPRQGTVDLAPPEPRRRSNFFLFLGSGVVALGGLVLVGVLAVAGTGEQAEPASTELAPVVADPEAVKAVEPLAAPVAAPLGVETPPVVAPVVAADPKPSVGTSSPEKVAADAAKAAAKKAAADAAKLAAEQAAADAARIAAEKAATPAAGATGKIKVNGAGSYKITNSAGATVKGALPEGRYTVTASWGEHSAKVSVEVKAGETATVNCDEGFTECTVQ